jgi:hypothetical protein
MKTSTKHEESYFKPNYSGLKEYPWAFNPPVRHICALHKFADDDIWLLRFNSNDATWVKVREAAEEDLKFFEAAFPTTVREVEAAELEDEQ